MSDLVPLAWWERLERSDDALASDATLGIATALAQDGVTGVTVVLPRRPGVLVRARLAARAAGVDVRAEQIGSATLTLRFSRGRVFARRDRPEPEPRPGSPLARARGRWAWPGWLRARARAAVRRAPSG